MWGSSLCKAQGGGVNDRVWSHCTWEGGVQVEGEQEEIQDFGNLLRWGDGGQREGVLEAKDFMLERWFSLLNNL